MPPEDAASMEFLFGGRIAPLSYMKRGKDGAIGAFDGGVYDAQGNVSSFGIQRKGQFENIPAEFPPETEWAKLEGSHIFGGMLQNGHFGHFVAESLSRIWALRYLSREFRSVAWYMRMPERTIPGWASQLLQLVEPEIQSVVISVPTQADLVIVPRQMVRTGSFFIHGHPALRAALEPLRAVREGGAKRIYVSRSRMKAGAGGFILETAIERNLEAEGYRIIHPQEMSIREQLAAYNDADHLVFADGSAIHLFAMVARPDQKVFNVWRREAGGGFTVQIRSFGGQAVQGRPCIRSLWLPAETVDIPVASGKRRSTQNRMKALLDFDGLRDQLRNAGFIKGDVWQSPDEEEIRAEIDRTKQLLRFELREELTPHLMTA